MIDAIKVHHKIKNRSSESVKKHLVVKSIEVGQHVRQGDIYIRKIDAVTSNVKIKTKQLAPGNSKGSRHIVDDHVKLYHGYCGEEIQEFLKGPQISSETDFVVNHPEHANVTMPAGAYQVTYQTDFIRKNRVID